MGEILVPNLEYGLAKPLGDFALTVLGYLGRSKWFPMVLRPAMAPRPTREALRDVSLLPA